MAGGYASSQKWAILIGINGYHESLGRLKYSVNDCRRLAEVLSSGDDAFPSDHVLVLADDEANERKPTYANIHSWLASWLAQPDENDTVLVFFAGHGREMGGKCYLVPCDATLQTIHVTGIPVPHVQDLLNRCKARQKVLILDACHSGAGRDVSTMAAPMMETLSSGRGIYTLTSCDVDELSHEWEEKKQGVFSYYLAEALSGACSSDASGRLTAEAVYDWVYQHVRHWAGTKRCQQTPKRICTATGTVVLRLREPDWRALAQDLQQRLDKAQTAADGCHRPVRIEPIASKGRAVNRGVKLAVGIAAACLLLLAVLPLLRSIAITRSEERLLQRAQTAFDMRDYAQAKSLIQDQSFHGSLEGPRRELLRQAGREADLASATGLARTGNMAELGAIYAKYPSDQAFVTLASQAAEVVASQKRLLEEARTAFAVRQFDKVLSLLSPQVFSAEQEVERVSLVRESRRQSDLATGENLLRTDDPKALETLRQRYPNDPDFTKLVERANLRQGMQREIQLARPAVQRGDIEAVLRLKCKYPREAEVDELVKSAVGASVSPDVSADCVAAVDAAMSGDAEEVIRYAIAREQVTWLPDMLVIAAGRAPDRQRMLDLLTATKHALLRNIEGVLAYRKTLKDDLVYQRLLKTACERCQDLYASRLDINGGGIRCSYVGTITYMGKKDFRADPNPFGGFWGNRFGYGDYYSFDDLTAAGWAVGRKVKIYGISGYAGLQAIHWWEWEE